MKGREKNPKKQSSPIKSTSTYACHHAWHKAVIGAWLGATREGTWELQDRHCGGLT